MSGARSEHKMTDVIGSTDISLSSRDIAGCDGMPFQSLTSTKVEGDVGFFANLFCVVNGMVIKSLAREGGCRIIHFDCSISRPVDD